MYPQSQEALCRVFEHRCSCVSSIQTPVDTEDVQPAPNIDHLLSNIGRTGLLGEASGEQAQPVAASSDQANQ